MNNIDVAATTGLPSIDIHLVTLERNTYNNKPESSHQMFFIHQQVQQQLTGVVVRLLDVLKVLAFFDCV